MMGDRCEGREDETEKKRSGIEKEIQQEEQQRLEEKMMDPLCSPLPLNQVFE